MSVRLHCPEAGTSSVFIDVRGAGPASNSGLDDEAYSNAGVTGHTTKAPPGSYIVQVLLPTGRWTYPAVGA